MDILKLRQKLTQIYLKSKVYYDNEDFQRMFHPGDWVVLGYSKLSWDEDKPSLLDGHNIQFMWAIRLVNMPFDFQDIIHRYEYIVLFDCFRNSQFLHFGDTAAVSNAQRWFRPITTFEKLAIITLYNKKLK